MTAKILIKSLSITIACGQDIAPREGVTLGFKIHGIDLKLH